MRQYQAEINDLVLKLRNKDISRFVAVLNPEQLSYLETKRIVESLRNINLELDCMILNKYVENEMSRKIVEEFSNLRIYTVPRLERVRGIEVLENIATFIGDI